jgi:hypothetical protein
MSGKGFLDVLPVGQCGHLCGLPPETWATTGLTITPETSYLRLMVEYISVSGLLLTGPAL